MATVEEMNKGLNALLDVLDTLSIDKNKNGTSHLPKDKTKGVNAAWQGICKEYFGKTQGEDANAEAKQMAQIVSHLTRCKDAMCRLTTDAIQHSQDIAQALDKEKNDTAQLRARVEDLGRELRSLQSTNRNLQRQLDEKADEVKLQRALINRRDSQIQLRPGGKGEEEANKREDALVVQIEAIKAEHSETKARLQGRIKELDEHLRMEKMRRTSNASDITRDLLSEKKKIYQMEKEINAHQKYFLACVNGLRTDVRFMTDNEAPMVRQRLELVHDAILDGQFAILSGKLPAHYSASEDDIRTPLGKMIKEAAKPPPAESNGPSSTGTIKENDEPDDTSSEQTFDKEHPELINRATGRLDMYTALKCFPNMKEPEMKHHFDQFVKYDKSRDFNLDMGELVRALMTVAPGVKFTAAQIKKMKELMKEVDVDDTGTIDFYEYLIIYNLLTKEGGKSEIFHREMSSTSKENVSKACVIQ